MSQPTNGNDHNQSGHGSHGSHGGHSAHAGSHHVLSPINSLKVFGALIFFTVVTVGVAFVDLGVLNFPIAVAVATVKALLVVMFFMNVRYEPKENGVIFGTSFVFLMIFLVLTGFDLFYRRDPQPKAIAAAASGEAAKFTKPWESSPEIIAYGKGLFDIQCVSCHGASGKGDGVAAAALNPKPRNFTSDAEWKNGRKVTEIFGTLSKGLNAMPSFGSLPAVDRWALVHYVLHFGSQPPASGSGDFAKIGVDPTKELKSENKKVLPVDFAIERVATGG